MEYREEYKFRGSVFLVESKEHYFRMALPGSRNYIIRDILSYGDEVEIPEKIDGDPVTSFAPIDGEALTSLTLGDSGSAGFKPYLGLKKLRLPAYLGRFPLRNDLFPDLKELTVDEGNRIFKSDGKMLYKEHGVELFLSLAAGMGDERVIVPHFVKRIGKYAFQNTLCREIIFTNPDVSVEDGCFLNSVFYECSGPQVYIGNLLYHIKLNHINSGLNSFGSNGSFGSSDTLGSSNSSYSIENSFVIKEGTERIQDTAFFDYANTFLELRLPLSPVAFPPFAPGSLLLVDRVLAYEGSQKGLVEAMLPPSGEQTGEHTGRRCVGNFSPSGSGMKFIHQVAPGREREKKPWRKEICILDENGEEKDRIFLPRALSSPALSRLSSAWNERLFDYTKYESILDMISDREMQAAFVLHWIFRNRVNMNRVSIAAYLKDDDNALNFSKYVIHTLSEEKLCKLIRLGTLGENVLRFLLDISREKKLHVAVAYILNGLRNYNVKNKTGNTTTLELMIE